jgi:hypothetical protein
MLWYYLWVAPHVLQGIILFAMVRRGLLRQFPMFFLYTGFEILQSALLLVVSHSVSYFGSVYFQVYAVGLALSTAIRFGVIYELFSHFFHRYPALSGAGRLLFRGATLVLLVIAVGLAVSAPGNVMDHALKDAAYASLKTTTFAADRQSVFCSVIADYSCSRAIPLLAESGVRDCIGPGTPHRGISPDSTRRPASDETFDVAAGGNDAFASSFDLVPKESSGSAIDLQTRRNMI